MVDEVDAGSSKEPDGGIVAIGLGLLCDNGEVTTVVSDSYEPKEPRSGDRSPAVAAVAAVAAAAAARDNNNYKKRKKRDTKKWVKLFRLRLGEIVLVLFE